jgi:hypothetical protein
MTAKKRDPLAGKFFHSVREDREKIQWQGRVVARIGDSYLLQLFEWFAGTDSNQVLVPVSEMNHWLFYDSAEEMNHYYSQYFAAREAKNREASLQETP